MDRARLRRLSLVLVLCGASALITRTRVPFCPLAGAFGIPCPGCGLSRATLALVHGQVHEALHLHPLVLVLTPVFAWAVSAAAFAYVRGPRAEARPWLWLSSRAATLLASTLLVATLGVWGARFCGYFGGPVPVTTFRAWARTRAAPAPSNAKH